MFKQTGQTMRRIRIIERVLGVFGLVLVATMFWLAATTNQEPLNQDQALTSAWHYYAAAVVVFCWIVATTIYKFLLCLALNFWPLALTTTLLLVVVLAYSLLVLHMEVFSFSFEDLVYLGVHLVDLGGLGICFGKRGWLK